MATELRYNFFTKAHQEAVNAVIEPALKKMSKMEQLVRRADRLAKENALAHTQRSVEYHTYFSDLDRRTTSIVNLGNAPALSRAAFPGALSTEHIRMACEAAAQGTFPDTSKLIRDHYQNARIREHDLVGIRRALFAGIPSYALERAVFLYKELARFYKSHTTRMKPEQHFLVELGGSENIRGQLRDFAKASKQPVFYGMATEPVLTATMRRVMGVDYMRDCDPDEFLDPVRVWSGSSPGFLLGLLWAFGASNTTNQPCDIVGYPRNSDDERLTLEDFNMDLERIGLGHDVYWFVTFSIGGGPTMLFFIDQHTAMQMGSVQFF